jgi:hypothetical protein
MQKRIWLDQARWYQLCLGTEIKCGGQETFQSHLYRPPPLLKSQKREMLDTQVEGNPDWVPKDKEGLGDAQHSLLIVLHMRSVSSMIYTFLDTFSTIGVTLTHNHLNRKRQTFFYIQTWPEYHVGDKEKWFPEGSINYNSILQLDLFCR